MVEIENCVFLVKIIFAVQLWLNDYHWLQHLL